MDNPHPKGSLWHSDGLHVIERVKYVDPMVVSYDVTIDDPKYFTKPWSEEFYMVFHPTWNLLEYVCKENDRCSPGKCLESDAQVVEMANLITGSVQRLIHWMHMPVPIDRTDDAYFAPLKGLELQPITELYLGLVHTQDGLEGTGRRIAAAKKFVSKFGVASECGISRGRDANLAMNFIKTYAGAAAIA